VKVVDAGIVAALIGAVAAIAVVVVTAILGLRIYPRQKEVDRREELRKGRGTAYGDYLAAYADVERWNGVPTKEGQFAEALVKYSQKYSALFNVADNNVLGPTTEFHTFRWIANTSDLPKDKWEAEWRRMYAKMLFEMRADAFVDRSTLSEDEIAKSLPWYFEWQAEEKAQERVPSSTT
jgi:hypothetical protein